MAGVANLTKPRQLASLSNKIQIPTIRAFSTTKLIQQESSNTGPATKINFYVEEHKDKGYVVLKLNKAPVNSLNLEFLTELNIQIEKIEESKDIKGVILTSN